MTDRVTSMLERLPAPYGIEEGTILHELLSVVGLQLRIFDEDMDRVQRAHWVDHAFDMADLAKLGSLFQVPPAPWELRQLYRERLKATIAAILRGSVTRAQLDFVLVQILSAAQQALETRYMDVGAPARGGLPVLPFVEFPLRTRRSPDLLAREGLMRQLETFTATNEGIEPVPLQFVLRGVAGGRSAMPLLVNRTDRTALVFRGVVKAGGELIVRANDDGTLGAELDGKDVSDRMYSTRSFQAGPGRPELVLDEDPRAVMLQRGANQCWLISLAHYDDPGLGAAMFGMAAEELHQGVFGDGRWDTAVFYQDPVAGLDAWWVERTPASFRFEVPAGAVTRQSGWRRDPQQDRTDLFRLMQETVGSLRGAAVAGEVRAMCLQESQSAMDRVAVLAPVHTTEEASSGEDRVSAFGARFDETARDRGRYE